VIVATQDNAHAAPALAMIEKGYAVMLEKPMAPTEAECREIVKAATGKGVIFAVCHVLRYTTYYTKLKELVDSGVIGDIVTVRHLEPVCYWHQAHSYVRGNWRNSKESSPMILAKSCHDMDILLYLIGSRCERLSSFGSLRHFRKESKPAGAASRCLDCKFADEGCPYPRRGYIFATGPRRGTSAGLSIVVSQDFSVEGVTKALKEGPYGRCVYECDNDVVDNQTVNFEFEGPATATFTMTAFTASGGRETEIMGTMGVIKGDSSIIELTRFEDGAKETFDCAKTQGMLGDGHGGGDGGIVRSFVAALRAGDQTLLKSGAAESLESHLMAFAAEKSRLSGGEPQSIEV
jgi:predicted dehydrogenase